MHNKLSKWLISVLLTGVSALVWADDAKKQKYFSKFDLDASNHLSLAEYSNMLKVRFEKKRQYRLEEAGKKNAWNLKMKMVMAS